MAAPLNCHWQVIVTKLLAVELNCTLPPWFTVCGCGCALI
jgi:hypothetical protein